MKTQDYVSVSVAQTTKVQSRQGAQDECRTTPLQSRSFTPVVVGEWPTGCEGREALMS